MKALRGWVFIFLAIPAWLSAAVQPRAGFVYPAGGIPGATLTLTVGGMHLKECVGVNLSGADLEAKQTDYLRVYEKREANRLRRQKEQLEARMEETSDEALKQQMQRQIDFLGGEMEMVMEMRAADKRNPAMAARKQFNPQIAERATLEVKLPESLAPGEYELRVVTREGLSNPLVFQVGALPERREQEPNDGLAKAEMLEVLPVLINGQMMPGDMDYFRFRARRGQKLVFRAEARALIPYLADAVPGWFQAVLTLYDAQGHQVAYNDDYISNPDPVLIFEVPKDGEYTVAVRDSIFRGREDFVYRLAVGELPFIDRISPPGAEQNREAELTLHGANLPSGKVTVKTGPASPQGLLIQTANGSLPSNRRLFEVSALPGAAEAEPNNRMEQAQPAEQPVVFNGAIDAPGDRDWFRFTGRKGEQRTVAVSARRFGSPLDARLAVLTADKKVIASSDDVDDRSAGLITHHADARIDLTLPGDGTYYVQLGDVQGKGGPAYTYRLLIGREQPDFQLRITPSSLQLPKKGSALATVHVLRTGGFAGPVEVRLIDPPEGVSLPETVVPEGAGSLPLSLSVSPLAQNRVVELQLEGTAVCGGETVARRAVPAEDMMQAFIYRHLVTAQKLMGRIQDPDPVAVTLTHPPEGVYKARPGSEISISASIIRNEPSKGAVKLTLSDAPEWLTLGSPTIGMKGANSVVLKVSPNAEPGQSATVMLNGSARVESGKGEVKFNAKTGMPLKQSGVEFMIDALTVQVVD